MRNIRLYVESFYLRQALYRLGLVLGLFMFCRICFFAFNYTKLPTPSVSTFFWGIRFDLSAPCAQLHTSVEGVGGGLHEGLVILAQHNRTTSPLASDPADMFAERLPNY